MDTSTSELDLIMPVYNEGETIASTLQEWWDEVSPHVNMRFVVTEDGSRDNTKEVLRACSESMSMKLDMINDRRGYSRAVIDAFRAANAPYVLAVDSDGQCDPKDFWEFWKQRDDYDVIIGWRVQRGDSKARKLMSAAFKLWHWSLFKTPLHDPSCPYVLIRQSVLQKIVPHLGVLNQGLWWEFAARIYRAKFSVLELPVQHRIRAGGTTQVYKPTKVPRIAVEHGLGLLKVRWQTRSGAI
jgi:dolichol-phosphate mannosyltransferase